MKAIVNIILAAMLSLGVYASPQNTGEKQIHAPGKEFTVEILNVSPELNKGKNGKIEMSSAFMVKETDSSEEFFGSFWAEFNVEKGNTNGIYKTTNWMITDIRLGDDVSLEELKQVEKLLNDELSASFAEIPKVSIRNNESAVAFNTEAPLILYSNFPSALIVIDGDPYYEELDKRYSKISNAGAFIVKDSKSNTHYLFGAGLWFTSEEPLTGWEYNENVPNRIKKVMKENAPELYDSVEKQEAGTRIVPQIIVSTEPTELISTDGKPEYVVIPEANLVYVKNTSADLFRDLTTNQFYSLFSGRWFTSDRLEGNWEFLAPDSLPKGFAAIPEDHDKSTVLASVPGTKAAEDAVRDAQVPYVTKKNIATLLDTEVNYNGEPEFVEIEGTELKYAVNTSSPVMLWNNRYYLVEDATWYNSSSAHGPWRIATQRPVGVEDIPAANPMFNLKYVYIYKQTDSEIYTGYTSGYTGSYVDGPTVVYGTGYHYSGWYGHYYYHHPMTYGFGFYYHPFYGWGPYYSPWFHSSFYWHWYYRPWYGYRPPYYRPPHYRPPGHRPPHHRPKPEHPIERPGRPDRPTTGPVEPGTRPSTRPVERPTQPSTRPVNRPAQPSTRPSTRPVPPSTRPSVRPSQPSYRPGSPSMRPSVPMSRPAPRPAPMRMR